MCGNTSRSIAMDIKDCQQDAYSNDEAISSDLPGLDPLFISKIEETVKDEHVINNHEEYDKWKVQKMCVIIDSPWKLRQNKDCIHEPDNDEFKVETVCLETADINTKYDGLVELIDNKYIQQFTYYTLSNTESKFSNTEHNGAGSDHNTNHQTIEEHEQSIRHILYILVRRYSRQYFHHQYEDIIKMIIFYYASRHILLLIKLSLNNINWDNLKLIKSEIINNNLITESIAISPEAMNKFCFIALKTDNLIQIDEKEWVLIVHVIDDDGNCDIGVSFKYNDKCENLFVVTAMYLDKTSIELKHKLIGLKYNYCENIISFSLRNITFINDDDDDNEDDMTWISEMECQSDWESV